RRSPRRATGVRIEQVGAGHGEAILVGGCAAHLEDVQRIVARPRPFRGKQLSQRGRGGAAHLFPEELQQRRAPDRRKRFRVEEVGERRDRASVEGTRIARRSRILPPPWSGTSPTTSVAASVLFIDRYTASVRTTSPASARASASSASCMASPCTSPRERRTSPWLSAMRISIRSPGR